MVLPCFVFVIAAITAFCGTMGQISAVNKKYICWGVAECVFSGFDYQVKVQT